MLKKYLTYILFLFLGLLSVYSQESFNTLMFKGNHSFDKKNYDKASSIFLDAIKAKNSDFGAHYNLGNTFYKKKMYDQAAAEYQKAHQLTKDKDEKTAALYNLGNTYLQEGKADKAINSYKNALKLDVDNQAILKNLQIAKKLKDKKHNQQNKNGNQNQQNTNNKNEDPKNKQEGNKNQKEQNKNSKTPENGSLGNQNKGDGNQNQAPNPSEEKSSENKIPKDLQKLILERSAQQEKETARKLLNKKAYSTPQSNEKDW